MSLENGYRDKEWWDDFRSFEKFRKRFWDRFRFGSGIVSPFGVCWIWTGRKNSKGYGVVKILYKRYFTHRKAWELAYGPIPEGMNVLHKCDTPACGRPTHLFLGTQEDNMHDMKKKGRARNVHTKGQDA